MEGTTTPREDTGCVQGACPMHLHFLSWSGNEAVGKNLLPPSWACPSPETPDMTWKPTGHSCIRLFRNGPWSCCSERPECSRPQFPLEPGPSLQRPPFPPQGTGSLTLVKPSADLTPAHWLCSFINRPISHLALPGAPHPRGRCNLGIPFPAKGRAGPVGLVGLRDEIMNSPANSNSCWTIGSTSQPKGCFPAAALTHDHSLGG